MVKIGYRLFLPNGPAIVRRFVREMRFRVFLDLKFPGIPSEVFEASAEATRFGVTMFTVYGLGGLAMMQAARAGVEKAMAEPKMDGRERPRVLATTITTSQGYASLLRLRLVRDSSDLKEEFRPAFEDTEVERRVVEVAQLAQEAGLDGVVASSREVASIRKACGSDFVIVATGINAFGIPAYDQMRTGTAGQAVQDGADYVVAGRMLLGARDPIGVAGRIICEITTAMQTRKEA